MRKLITATLLALAAMMSLGVWAPALGDANSQACQAIGPGYTYTPAYTDSNGNPVAASCDKTGAKGLTGDNGLLKASTNTLIFVAGAVAVVVIIIGGIGYIASTGDPGRITKAKNTILYAVIGLIVAILAYAIVNYVVGAIS